MHTNIIESVEELLEYETAYRQFINKFDGVESQFYSLDYIQVSYQYFNNFGYKMYFILCIEDEKIVALFPFQRRFLGPSRLIKKISFWGDVPSEATNLFKTFLIIDDSTNVIKFVVRQLNTKLSKEWDAIEIYRIFISKDVECFNSLFNKASTTTANQSYVYRDTGDSVYVNNSKRYKKMVKLENKLLNKTPNSSYVIDFKVDKKLFKDLADIHTNHQLSKKQTTNKRRLVFENVGEYDYLRKLYVLWGEEGWLRCYRLLVENKTIAYLLVRKSGIDAFAFFIAYDEQYSKYDLTRMLFYKATKDLVENEGIKEVDFAWGGTKPKEDFANYIKPLHNIIISSPRLVSLVKLFILKFVKRGFYFITNLLTR